MTQHPNTNLRAFNQVVRTLLTHPSHILPHLTIPTLIQLPENNLGAHLQYSQHRPQRQQQQQPTKNPTIRALVLDKDNTLCPAKTTSFPPSILAKLHSLRQGSFNRPDSILIVSNRAGSHPVFDNEVGALEKQLAELKIPVFRLPAGSTKKPFCGEEVVQWFKERGVVDGPAEIAVVGDRLGTDGIMARTMGSWSVWCRDGVWEGMSAEEVWKRKNMLEKMESWVEGVLAARCGWKAPAPKGWLDV